MICMYALRLSTTTVEDEEEDDDDEEEASRVRSSSARCPEKERHERRKRGLGSRDQVEKAVMKPVGSNGSSSSRWASTGGRSGVTRQRGLSWARRWKRWWGWDCRSSITCPHDAHSVMERPELVVAHRPCAKEQYGHFIARLASEGWSDSVAWDGLLLLVLYWGQLV